MQAYSVYGSPGTGKSTELIRRVDRLGSSGVPPERIAFVSFTRAATEEALSRIKNDKFVVSTVHAMCYRKLGLKRQVVVNDSKLNRFFGELGVEYTRESLDLDNAMSGIGAPGNEYLSVLSLARSRMADPYDLYDSVGELGTMAEFAMFLKSYETWKDSYGFLDFSDMLEAAIHAKVGADYDVMFIDEAQDLSDQQWAVIRSMLKHGEVKEVHVAGDDDQCQPPGTMVLTPSGETPIEMLKNGDTVLSYSQSGSHISPRKIKVGSRWWEGVITIAKVGNKSSSYTPNHRCMVRYKRDDNIRCVYLMKKGSRFRIGQTKLFRKNNSKRNSYTLYPVYRARQEKADCFWILSTHTDEESAQIQEKYLSYKYGIPQEIFGYHGLKLSTKYNVAVWGKLDELPMWERADQLLGDMGLCLSLPHIKSSGGDKHFECYAANLHPDVHEMATVVNGKLVWQNISIERKKYSGYVYSLEVDKTSTYFGDGIYTHNSIHSWAGANPHGMMEFEGEFSASRVVLPVSHRLPRSVHDLAVKTINTVEKRVFKAFGCRDDEGSVVETSELPDIEDNSLVLARTNMLVLALERDLIERRVPYTKLGSRGHGAWNTQAARAIRVWKKFEAGEEITDLDETMVAAACNGQYKQKVMDGGLKEVLHLPWQDCIVCNDRMLDFYEQVYDRLGEDRNIRLGTIHASKGMEADNVYLSTATTQRVLESAEQDPDSEVRVQYVGMTRARHNLTLIEGN